MTPWLTLAEKNRSVEKYDKRWRCKMFGGVSVVTFLNVPAALLLFYNSRQKTLLFPPFVTIRGVKHTSVRCIATPDLHTAPIMCTGSETGIAHLLQCCIHTVASKTVSPPHPGSCSRVSHHPGNTPLYVKCKLLS